MFTTLINALIAWLYSLVPPRPMTQAELHLALGALAQRNPEHLDWSRSVVDLMKLLNMDSSIENREQLAKHFGYSGNAGDGSAEKNAWLQRQLMAALREHTIPLPQ